VSDRRKPTAGTLVALPFPGAGGPEPAVVTTLLLRAATVESGGSLVARSYV